MSFASPLWLFLGLLAIPILLSHARRYRRIEVASMPLWRLIAEATPPRPQFHWPRFSPLLAAQLAVVLIAALAMAQPRLAGDEHADHTVFMIDVSASMGALDVAPSRFDAARVALSERLGRLEQTGDGRVSVIAAGETAQPFIVRQRAHLAARNRLDRLVRTDGGADWKAAFALAEALSLPGEVTRLVFLTDGPVETPAAEAANHEFVTFGTTDTPNAALAAAVARLDGEGAWSIAGQVVFAGGHAVPEGIGMRFGPEGVEGDLDWGWIPLDSDGIEIDQAGNLVARFSGEARFPGAGRLQLMLLPDAGPHDDRAAFVLGAGPRGLDVLWVGRALPPLVRGLAGLGPVRLTQADELPDDAEEFDLVIVHDAAIGRRPQTNLLLLGRADVAGEPQPGALAGGLVTSWQPQHPLMRNLDWSALDEVAFHPTPAPPGWDALLEAGGNSLVSARTTEWGREVRVALDPERSGWTAQPSFPAFVYNLVAWLGIDPSDVGGVACRAGRACPLEAREATATITGPDGGRISNSGAIFVPPRSGFYLVESSTRSRHVAVQGALSGEADIRLPIEVAGIASSSPVPLWRWFAAALVVALVLEAGLATREARRQLARRPSLLWAQAGLQKRLGFLLRPAALAAALLALVPGPLPIPEARTMLVAIGDADLPPASRAGRISPAVTGQVFGDIGAGGRPAGIGPVPAPLHAVNLEGSLSMGLAMLPEGKDGRLVLAPALGETVGYMRLARSGVLERDVPVDAWSPAPVREDVLVRDVLVPRQVREGDSYPVVAFVHSDHEAEVTLTILRDGLPVTERSTGLAVGTTRVEATLEADAAGEVLIEIALGRGDAIPANDRAGAVVRVLERGSVLIVAQEPRAAESFAHALSVQGMDALIRTPSTAPARLEDWLAHDLVVLMNMPARAFSIANLETLATSVRDHGTGLMILGGEQSFGPGGYYGSPLEDLSPLSARVPHDAPVAALVFVIDRSGSMQGAVGNVTRLDIAKAATLSAAELLGPESSVGILAFDQESHEVLALTRSPEPATVDAALAPLQPGGGTVLLPTLERAVATLESAEAELKHVIVMTDGLIELADFTPLLARAAEIGITVSTIAFGSSAVTDRLSTIADGGGGSYYATRDFRALPSILAEETLTMTDRLIERSESPVVLVGSPPDFLSQLPEPLPPVSGFVRTTLKPGANLHFEIPSDAPGDEPAPLLASWRLGNGQVVAFATQAAGAGNGAWQAMAEYPRFWAQIARQLLPDAPRPGLGVALHREGDQIAVMAVALDERGAPISDAAPTATLESDPGSVFPLREVRPGEYATLIPLPALGTHRATVELADMRASAALHAAYWASADTSRGVSADLQALVTASGGRHIASLDQLPKPGLEIRWRQQWQPWVLLALALFAAGPVWRGILNLTPYLRRRTGRPVAASAAPTISRGRT